MFLQAVEDVFQSIPFAKIITALDNALIVTKVLQLLMANVSLHRRWIPTANREMGRVAQSATLAISITLKKPSAKGSILFAKHIMRQMVHAKAVSKGM